MQSPKLLQQIIADMDACGMVREATNKLVGYLAATSRKLENPIAIVIQSSSAGGEMLENGADLPSIQTHPAKPDHPKRDAGRIDPATDNPEKS